MAAQNTFQTLAHELERWHDALTALHCTVAEDRPAANDVALADYYESAVTDALGWLSEALDAARAAARAEAGGDSSQVRRALAIVQQRVESTARHHLIELAGWDRVVGLAELGARRGRAWSGWAEAVRRSLEAAPEPQLATQAALADAWQEIAGSSAAPARSFTPTAN